MGEEEEEEEREDGRTDGAYHDHFSWGACRNLSFKKRALYFLPPPFGGRRRPQMAYSACLPLGLDDGTWDVGDNFTPGRSNIFSFLHMLHAVARVPCAICHVRRPPVCLFPIALISALRPRIDMGGPPLIHPAPRGRG